jgi:hypothetical protein
MTVQVETATSALTEAQASLVLWKAALNAVSAGQSYQVGKLQLTRVNVKQCREMVLYYQGEVDRLTNGTRQGARQMRYVPRDL